MAYCLDWVSFGKVLLNYMYVQTIAGYIDMSKIKQSIIACHIISAEAQCRKLVAEEVLEL